MTLTLCFLACAFHGPVPIAAAQQGGASSAFVVAMNRAAYNRLAVVEQGSRVLEDGRLEVSVQLRNRESTELPVHLDVQFRTPAPEEAGAEAHDDIETSWKMLRIPGDGTEALTVASLAPGPSSYTVELWVL
jgi:hypothetical protein